MPARSVNPLRADADNASRAGWLQKHADYQRVYREGRRQSLPLMTYFFAPRSLDISNSPSGTVLSSAPVVGKASWGPRIGLTAGRVLGNAVERNRIKRRMRAAVRQHAGELTATVDVILHPRRTVLQAQFSEVARDVLRAFRAVQAASPAPASGASEGSAAIEPVFAETASEIDGRDSDTAHGQ